MLNTGAYSTKYQQLERDRMRQLQDKRQNSVQSSKAQLYSKQTAKRQKALEERKRAMAVAEEERRRKALEERRQAQRDATNRFKSAMSKIKTTKSQGHSATIHHRNENLRIEMYLPDKARAALPGKKVAAERVTLGKEVEVSTQHAPVRTPSLDDVLRSVRGSPREERSTQEVYRQQPLPSRSVSDTSLNLAHQERINSNDPGGGGGGKIIMHQSAIERIASKTVHPPDASSRDVVFSPVTRTSLPRATASDNMRVVSPELPDSLSSGSPSDGMSTSPPLLDDSLDGETTPPMELRQATRRKKRGERVRSSQIQPIFVPQSTSPSLVVTGLHAFGQRDIIDSDTSSESLDDRIQHGKIERKWYRNTNSRGESSKTEPKIVGILKRNGLTPHPSAATTAQSSQVISAAVSSILEDAESVATVSSQLTTMSKSSKKVRFVDQVISPFASASKNRMPDEARQVLWSRILPNGIATNFPPNSAFTPKLRVTLSSNGVPKNSQQTPPNGITVHVPRAAELSPPPSPPTHPVKLATPPPDGSKPTEKSDSEAVEVVQSTSDGAESVDEPDRGLTMALDKTPTDDDINELWGQIRECLHEDRKVTVPPRVFNFRTLPQQSTAHPMRNETRTTAQLTPSSSSSSTQYRVDSPTTSASSLPRHKPPSTRGHRDASKTTTRGMRCQGHLHQQPPIQLWKRHHHFSNPHTSSHEPAASRSSRAGGGSRQGVTALSLEEQRLMHSIEKLNQRLKNHLNCTPDSLQEPHPPPHVTSDPSSKRGSNRGHPSRPRGRGPGTSTASTSTHSSTRVHHRQHL